MGHERDLRCVCDVFVNIRDDFFEIYIYIAPFITIFAILGRTKRYVHDAKINRS